MMGVKCDPSSVPRLESERLHELMAADDLFVLQPIGLNLASGNRRRQENRA